jgi:hypothetical protein
LNWLYPYDRTMGYTTYFHGFWTLTPALSLAQTDYLQKFSRTRRVKRNPDAITDRRLAAIRLDLGVDAEGELTIKGIDWSIMGAKNLMSMSHGSIIWSSIFSHLGELESMVRSDMKVKN